MAPKHQLGSGMHAIYRPSSMRTIGYKRDQVGAGFFTSLAPKLKFIGKKFNIKLINIISIAYSHLIHEMEEQLAVSY